MDIKNVSPLMDFNQKIKLNNDFELLDIMLNDSKKQPLIYQPGPYWINRAKNSVNEIKRCGIGDFRGSTNFIGLSYADNLVIDIRNSLNNSLKGKFLRWVTKIYPLSNIFSAQIQWTEFYAKESLIYAQEMLSLKERTRNLLKKYSIPYSLLGNCQQRVKINGEDYSIHYLNLLEQHDNIALNINFNDAKSIFEIGGGFGANVHLLLSNYKNIRKVLYLDIAPNLYVGTQYLKAFYGDAVFDYRALKNIDSIKFSLDDSIEIFCISPWQIEKFKSGVDIFLNSHSFVEMPKNVVKNYFDNFNKFPNSKDSAIALTTYDGFDLNTTFHPDELPKIFESRNFIFFESETLLNAFRKNIYFISNDKQQIKR